MRQAQRAEWVPEGHAIRLSETELARDPREFSPRPAESVAMVCMPFHTPESASIPIGILHSVLEGAGVPCSSHSFHLEFMEDLLALDPQKGGLSATEYDQVCSRWINEGLGDWIFAVKPASPFSRNDEKRQYARLRSVGLDQEYGRRLLELRKYVPDFLERCADEIMATKPSMVGFTLAYSQTWPSASLGYVLKQRDPDIKIVFGGTACEGVMGPALLKAFPWVDAVTRGEAEGMIVDLSKAVVEGTRLSEVPGVCAREDDEVREGSLPAPAVNMRDSPMPNYDEFYERRDKKPLVQANLPARLLIEGSRGCWWGEGKNHHCAFCGLNGEVMKFRSKPAEKLREEMVELSRRHGVLDFTAVDNIFDNGYFGTLLPALASEPSDFTLFYETKANLKLQQVALLAAAGVGTIQPGIESLSSHVLKLMHKGVSALQNVRLLKWCAEYGIHVVWNLLYGFPGETAEDYQGMAEFMPALHHLTPPNPASPIAVYRFSPHFREPEKYGLRIEGPLPHYASLFKVDPKTLHDLAHNFRFSYEEERQVDTYAGPALEAVEDWRTQGARRYRKLIYRPGPDFLRIHDLRPQSSCEVSPITYDLDQRASRIYMACDAGASLSSLERKLARDGAVPRAEIQRQVEDFVDADLMIKVDGKYLATAVCHRPRVFPLQAA